MAQERDYLDRAAEAYRQSLNLYLSLKDLSNVGGNIRAVQRALNSVEKQINEMSGGTEPFSSAPPSSPEPPR